MTGITVNDTSETLVPREFALACIRIARIRSRLITVEIDAIAAALKGDMIGPDEAFMWLRDAGGLDLLLPEGVNP